MTRVIIYHFLSSKPETSSRVDVRAHTHGVRSRKIGMRLIGTNQRDAIDFEKVFVEVDFMKSVTMCRSVINRMGHGVRCAI